ncbi:MAG: clostripain-related cysteine peptidase [Brevinematales bacterium]|nr:clostripain-related cysteine peptidase [Brevinematales bacterium]
MRQGILCILFLFMGCTSLSEKIPLFSSLSHEEHSDEDWLFLVYMAGDNNLESAALGDMNEIEKGLYDLRERDRDSWENIRVLVLLDRSVAYDTSDGNWYGARLYEAKPGIKINQIESSLLEDWGAVNMGDPLVLKRFLREGIARYVRAKYKALIIWNHGNGIDSFFSVKGKVSTKWAGEVSLSVAYDGQAGDELTLAEFPLAFAGTEKLDLIGMDACLMGMYEVAYQLRAYARYYVASPDLEGGDGWAYDDWIYRFSKAYSPEDMARLWLDSYRLYSEGYHSLSWFDLRYATNFFLSLHEWVRGVKDYETEVRPVVEGGRSYLSDPMYVDLLQIMTNLTNALYSFQVRMATEEILGVATNFLRLAVMDGNWTHQAGLSAFWCVGHVEYLDWYTHVVTSSPRSGIEAAWGDTNGEVESYKELQEYWYRPFGGRF